MYRDVSMCVPVWYMCVAGNYWVCYHCHEKNSKEEAMCKLCEMLSCYTHPSWEVDGKYMPADVGLHYSHQPLPYL